MAKRIGLVLGSGGSTGSAFHAAVLKALADAGGWDARDAAFIVGTSAGSITGSSLRAGFSPADIFARHVREPLSPEGKALLAKIPQAERDDPELGLHTRGPQAPDLLKAYATRPRSLKIGVVAAAALPEGKMSTVPISSSVGGMLDDKWPDKPLWICATKLSDGDRVVYGKDDYAPVGLAAAASCAIPGYFRPVEINGIKHVDGGMYSACNADLMANLELDTLIVSSPMSTHSTVARTLDLPFRQFLKFQLDAEVKPIRAAGTEVIILAPSKTDLPVMGFNPMAPGREEPVARSVLESVSARIDEEGLRSAVS